LRRETEVVVDSVPPLMQEGFRLTRSVSGDGAAM
jgi:hypothetical protein